MWRVASPLPTNLNQLNVKTVLFHTIQLSISTKLNGSKYCYLSLTFQLDISHLFTQLNDQTVLFRIIQLSLSTVFCLHTVKCKRSKFQTIQFSVITQFSSFLPINMNLSGGTTRGQNGPGIEGNEGELLPFCRDAVGVFCCPSRLGN